MSRLVALDGKGLVELRTGRGAGWALTQAGRARLQSALAAELDGGGLREAVAGSYERLVPLNAAFKQLCTRWQLCSLDPMVPNDHDDLEYDRRLISDLAALHRDAVAVIGEAAAALPRFAAYAERLGRALEQLEGGGLEWFTKPGIGSYHDVWMQLHQDFLLTLGLERGAGDA